MLSKQMRWVYIALPIFMFWFLGQTDKLGISIIQTDPQFLLDLGLTGADKNAKIGLLTLAFTIAYAVSNIFWGFIIDKLGARKTAILGVCVWTITMVMAGLSQSYETFMLSRILLGLGEGMMIPVSNKFISSWFHKRETGRAQASWISGNYLGPAIGTFVLSIILASLHWQGAFYFLALCNLLINIPMFLFMTRDLPEEHKGLSKEELAYIREGYTRKEKNSNKNTQNFAQDFRYWIVWVGMLVASFLFFGLSIWLPTYLIQGKNFSPDSMTSITSLSWLFALAFVLINGYFADKTKRPALQATLMFALCAIFLTITFTTSNPLLAGICLGLAMGTQGGVFHLSNLFIVKYSTPETAGRAAGLMGFTNILGGFSSYIMGWLRDISNGDFGPSIIMLIIVSIIGFVAYLFSLKKEAEEVRLLKS
jgi:sugar phosphate permease